MASWTDGTGCKVQFWRDELSEVQCWKPSSGQELTERSVGDLETQFGTASEYLEGEFIVWKDESIRFGIFKGMFEYKGNIVYLVSDQTIQQAKLEAECVKSPPTYERAPEIKSFY